MRKEEGGELMESEKWEMWVALDWIKLVVGDIGWAELER